MNMEQEKFEMTAEEMEKFKKSLKNPEFKKLFFDYVTELQDPENKRIYEEELAKLEAEKGNNVRYVKPEPWCVIKTKQLNIEHQIDKSNPNEKVFINICSSPEIQESKFNQQNKSWSIPYSLAKGREDYDKEKKPCYVYDCIFHPTTIKLGANPKFQNLIFTTAIEGIEKQFNFELKKDFKLLKMKSKGTPLMTIIREKMEGKPLPKETTYDFLKSLQQQKMEEDAKQSIPKAPIIEEIIESNENQKPIQPILEIPSFTIVHQNSFSDYQKYTSEKERQYGARPDALVIRIVLPKINSAKPVELDVTENALDLFVPNKYKLHLDLPFPVNDDKGTARFEKNTSTLIVTVPVVPVVVPVPEADDSNIEIIKDDEENEETLDSNEINHNSLPECTNSESVVDLTEESGSTEQNILATVPQLEDKSGGEVSVSDTDAVVENESVDPKNDLLEALEKMDNLHISLTERGSEEEIIADTTANAAVEEMSEQFTKVDINTENASETINPSPPFHCSQSSKTITIIVDLEHIDNDSIVKVESSHTLKIDMSAKNTPYTLGIQFKNAISHSTLDVSDKNLCIVIHKIEEDIWDDMQVLTNREYQTQTFLTLQNIHQVHQSVEDANVTLEISSKQRPGEVVLDVDVKTAVDKNEQLDNIRKAVFVNSLLYDLD